MERALKTSEAAKLLNVSERTLLKLVQSNSIPYVRVGCQYRFSREGLESWFRRQEEAAVLLSQERLRLAEANRPGSSSRHLSESLSGQDNQPKPWSERHELPGPRPRSS